jgi:hypothetical protein
METFAVNIGENEEKMVLGCPRVEYCDEWDIRSVA